MAYRIMFRCQCCGKPVQKSKELVIHLHHLICHQCHHGYHAYGKPLKGTPKPKPREWRIA